MLKFKYNYLTNTLAYQKHELWYQIPEEEQFTRFSSHGFILEPSNHWIQFTIYEKQIKVFYKCSESPFSQEPNDFFNSEKITYYRQYLPKEEEIIFAFDPQDEVEKVGGKWIKKGNHD